MLKVITILILTTILTIAVVFKSEKTKIVKPVKVETVNKIKVVKYDTLHIKRATRYHATTSQCDNSPFKTADGSLIDPVKVKNGKQKWIALSRDLILDTYRNKIFNNRKHWNGYFQFGDTVIIKSKKHPHINGKWVVHDCMSASANNSIDFLSVLGITPRLGVGTDIKIIIKKS